MPNDFFKLLRKKLERTPSKEFEEKFWSDFDRAFKPRKQRTQIRLAWLAPAFSLALVLFYFSRPTFVDPEAELLNNLDMLAEFDELPTSDEEWALLMPEENS